MIARTEFSVPLTADSLSQVRNGEILHATENISIPVGEGRIFVMKRGDIVSVLGTQTASSIATFEVKRTQFACQIHVLFGNAEIVSKETCAQANALPQKAAST